MDSSLANLQTRYSEAFTRRDDAQARLNTLSEQHQPQRETARPTRSRSHRLAAHLQGLRQSRQQNKLAILRFHSQEARRLLRDIHVDDPLRSPVADSATWDFKGQADEPFELHLQSELNVLSAKSRTLQNDLEIQLVKIRQHLKHENALLHGVQMSQAISLPALTNAQSRLYALEKTREELQIWLTNSLARCEQIPDNIAVHQLAQVSTNSPQRGRKRESKVSAEYDKYLHIRARLLRVMYALRTLQENQQIKPRLGSLAQVAGSRGIQELRGRDSASISQQAVRGLALSQIQSDVLPSRHYAQLVEAYAAHLRNQSEWYDAKLLKTLSLLSHESHLLPLYHSENHNTPIFGDFSKRQHEIDQLLYAWSSASDAANDAWQEAVICQKNIAKRALTYTKADLSSSKAGAVHRPQTIRVDERR